MNRRRSRYYRRALMMAAILAMAVVVRMILPQPTITIAVHQGVEGVPMKQVAARFCEDRYHGKVKVVELAYDELFAAEWWAVTGEGARYPFSTPPRFDVIMLDDPWLPAFVRAGGEPSRLMPLDAARLAGEGGMNDFPEPCRRVCRFDERGSEVYYALPFTGNSQLLCRVVKDVKQQPANWEEVRKLPGKDKLPYAMRLGPGNSVVTDFLPILWSYAPESFTEHDYSRLDSEKAAQALRMFHSLAYGQHWASAVTQDVDVAVAIALDAASTGVVWNAWAMALERLRDRIAPTTGELEFGWFDKQQPVLGAWLLAVPQNAPHPKQAMEFIEYAIGKEQLKLAARYGNPPPRISILSDPESRERYRSFPAQLDSLQRARPRPRTPCWREVEKVVSGALSMWREEESKKVVAKLLGDLDGIRRREERAGCVAQ